MTATDPEPIKALEQEAEQFRRTFDALRTAIGRRIVGHEDLIERLLIGLFCGGHLLLEGVPGLGKTMLVKALAESIDLSFSRIQCTPDLMPADLIGTDRLFETDSGERRFRFQPGPIFAQVVLADEINRATPKTQSALLEAMQEASVTVGGVTHKLEEPFIVLGTQNPIEMEGTYPLPEAQLDRFFFKLMIEFPQEAELLEIIDRTTAETDIAVQPVVNAEEILALRRLVRRVAVAEHLKRYVVRIVTATHPQSDSATPMARQYVRYGASPRGIQALILAGKARALLHGRFHLGCEDIRAAVHPSLRHRLLLNFEGEAEEIRPDAVLDEILQTVPELAPGGSA